MESELDSLKSTTESEEDDFGCYFLQPSSSPYNITEKVQQANMELFTSSPCPSNKETRSKVKFKNDLVSFEPDLTDDDVNSIESDNPDLERQSPDYKTTIVHNENSIYDIEEVEEKVEEEEEVIEEIHSDFDFGSENIEQKVKVEKLVLGEVDANETFRVTSSKSSSRNKRTKTKYTEVHCRDHCIDKLDFDLSMSIKKLNIQEKVSLPPLPLIQRKCCDEIKQKIPRNLPSYNGLRSEYGLTSRQLEKRIRQKEILKQKEELRRKLYEEYRQRKMQQNEEVFCQWLKEVGRRKTERQNPTKQIIKQSISPKTLILPVKNKDRPKTANEFIPKTAIKKKRRPHSTNSCVYIQVPHVLLEKGVSIGDFVITNSKKLSNRLHIVAVP